MMSRFVSFAAVLAAGSVASAAIVPFTETFAADSANWTGPSGTATWNATGHILADVNVNSASFGVAIGLRGQAMNNASGGAFVGNWITDGVTALSFDVRHDAPLPLSFGARLALPVNFPGAIGLDFVPKPAGVWSTVTIPINAGYAGWVSFEGSDFATIFSYIGNVQLLFSVPAALAGTGTIVRMEADNVRIVPAPGAAGVICFAAAFAGTRRRR